MEQVSELRPPAEHNRHSLHWIRRTRALDENGKPTDEVFSWSGRAWWGNGSEEPLTPKDAADLGFRYLGPAEWREKIEVSWSIPGDPNVWVRTPDLLTLSERARLVEIAHSSAVEPVRLAALDVLAAHVLIHGRHSIHPYPEPLLRAEDAPYA